jgi:hypothetical protein
VLNQRVIYEVDLAFFEPYIDKNKVYNE